MCSLPLYQAQDHPRLYMEFQKYIRMKVQKEGQITVLKMEHLMEKVLPGCFPSSPCRISPTSSLKAEGTTAK